ncbi:mechanosensitive ion channel family protein [Bacillus sp. AGMB 02131]|uniref:Mechanosensitive ion channel family protein n=1 Tax=Peribacillus faecalis TaxID=2772559 RepID=A0A927D0Q4_9BACI|nr:mechanosensitive ion channel family protein [Peribacillus faecalis]MBD3109335.1 mechanosensitive ion channel family protein [Peribacillus faecalis]
MNIINHYLDVLTTDEFWFGITDVVFQVTLIVIISGLIVKIVKKAIAKVFMLRAKSRLRTSERRDETMKRLLQNIAAYIIYFIAILMALDTVDINVKGLLAGAGIVGLAVGFGAQSLVKDVITGFFIIFEDQFAVGDFVRIGQLEGTVEEIGLRTTKIKNVTGELNIIPNGNILEVTNFSIHNSVAVVDFGISYEGDVERAERIITQLLESMPERYEDLVRTPELLGIQSFGASEIVLRITAETLPMRHFYIARQIRKELKETLDANGIEIPYPHMVMYSRQDEDKKQSAKQI